MHEPGAPSGASVGGSKDLISAVRSVFEECGSAYPRPLVDIVSLHLDYPLWAVWLPADGRDWVAVRPAGSRPPAPEVPMVWVTAETAVELGARMRVADAGLAPPGYGC